MLKPIGWEYRFFDTTNEPHHWTEWEPLKPKFRGHEHVQEMRNYIASGYCYQMRPIYAGPAEGWRNAGVAPSQAPSFPRPDVWHTETSETAPTRKITSLAEFCAEAERIGLTVDVLAEALSKRPEFADCLPGNAGVPESGEQTKPPAGTDADADAGIGHE